MTNMLDAQTRRIWVLVEQEEGKAHPVSWELLGAARRLALELDVEQAVVEGVLLGQGVGSIAQEAFRFGARRIYVIDDPVLVVYRNLPYSVGISRLVQAYRPEIFLIGATTLGHLASAIATRVQTGLTADCTELTIDPKQKSLPRPVPPSVATSWRRSSAVTTARRWPPSAHGCCPCQIRSTRPHGRRSVRPWACASTRSRSSGSTDPGRQQTSI